MNAIMMWCTSNALNCTALAHYITFNIGFNSFPAINSFIRSFQRGTHCKQQQQQTKSTKFIYRLCYSWIQRYTYALDIWICVGNAFRFFPNSENVERREEKNMNWEKWSVEARNSFISLPSFPSFPLLLTYAARYLYKTPLNYNLRVCGVAWSFSVFPFFLWLILNVAFLFARLSTYLFCFVSK